MNPERRMSGTGRPSLKVYGHRRAAEMDYFDQGKIKGRAFADTTKGMASTLEIKNQASKLATHMTLPSALSFANGFKAGYTEHATSLGVQTWVDDGRNRYRTA